MTLKIAYIPHRIDDKEGERWAENTMMVNLIANSSKDIEIIPAYDPWICLMQDIDLIVLHNLSHTAMRRRKWVRGGAMLERLIKRPISAFYTSKYDNFYSLKHRPKIIGGIRGYQGLNKARKILKYFDAIHVNNEDLRDKTLEYGARLAYVLYPGVDMELFTPLYGFLSDTFTIGWAGDTTKPVKNWHLIKELGYNYKIASKENFIPHDEMPRFYNSLDVFVHFSSHEGWGRCVMEAMACGLPVVSSSVGSGKLLNPEWVIEGDPREKDWISRFRNKVEILRNDPELRYRVGYRNREHVIPWSWPVIAKRFEHICRSLIYGG